MRTRDRWGYALVLAVVAAGLLANFGRYPLLDPDEGRNAEVAREMAVSNGYLLPRLNGLPYVDKPVLHFAVTALAMEAFGRNPAIARLPSLLFTMGTLVLVGWFATRLTDGAGGVTAVVSTAATPLTLAYSRTVIFDATLTFWVVTAVMCLHEVVERSRVGHAVDLWRAGAWGAMALGLLTKGPVAVLLPLLIAVPYAWWRGRLRSLVDPVAILLVPAIVIPWVAAMARDAPDFVRYVIFTETAARLSGDALGRAEPVWYFLAILPAGALPWTVVLGAHIPHLARRLRSRAEWTPSVTFLLLWVLLPLAFFSLTASKRPQYVLPIIPALGLLVAIAWHGIARRRVGVPAAGTALLAAGLALAALRHRIAPLVNAAPDIAEAVPPVALQLAAASIVAGLIVWVGRGWRPLVLAALAAPITVIPVVSADLMQAIGEDRSAVGLAAAIERVSPRGARIVAVHAYPLSLPFYLDRTITLVTDDASELTSNYLLRHPEIWRQAPTIRTGEWWHEAAIACDRPSVFVLRTDDTRRRGVLDDHLPIIATSRKYVAYGPCGPAPLARSP
ncbi:MAG TPA: glycosyltransferase family 39 protein [Gemmatimonadales bacterium]